MYGVNFIGIMVVNQKLANIVVSFCQAVSSSGNTNFWTTLTPIARRAIADFITPLPTNGFFIDFLEKKRKDHSQLLKNAYNQIDPSCC